MFLVRCGVLGISLATTIRACMPLSMVLAAVSPALTLSQPTCQMRLYTGMWASGLNGKGGFFTCTKKIKMLGDVVPRPAGPGLNILVPITHTEQGVTVTKSQPARRVM
ncbi:hypothetical protein F5Y01DRAFT_5187 [Xylaria sp. FL0043]|nr:hypothetical protein F5Y01DRAFT_5187 [Xylaria sp. FL0043]